MRVLVVDDEPSLACGYLTKPFSLHEVVTRLRELVPGLGDDRSYSEPMLMVGDLALNERSREVRRGGDRVDLTGTEVSLLCFRSSMIHAVGADGYVLESAE